MPGLSNSQGVGSLGFSWLESGVPGAPAGSVVKSLPAKAEDTGLIPLWEDRTGLRAAKPLNYSH